MAPTLLGSTLVWLGRMEDALPVLQAAVATGLALQEAYVNLGVVLLRLDRQEEAVAIWQEGISLDPDGPYSAKLATYIRQTEQKR